VTAIIQRRDFVDLASRVWTLVTQSLSLTQEHEASPVLEAPHYITANFEGLSAHLVALEAAKQ
jgi:hypothetical protein